MPTGLATKRLGSLHVHVLVLSIAMPVDFPRPGRYLEPNNPTLESLQADKRDQPGLDEARQQDDPRRCVLVCVSAQQLLFVGIGGEALTSYQSGLEFWLVAQEVNVGPILNDEWVGIGEGIDPCLSTIRYILYWIGLHRVSGAVGARCLHSRVRFAMPSLVSLGRYL